MSLNLIKNAWIPVRRRDGTTDTIRPADIVDYGSDGDNPPVELNAVRPDFDGALAQFLIGLLQTLCAPERERDWRRWLEQRPSSDTLHAKFLEFAHAFELEGGGPRFMQDFETLESKRTKPISYLLVDTPTGNTLKKNKDHFTKNRDDLRYCSTCTALSLMTLHLNAPGGGRGHRTSLRGGGPLTTVLLGANLWQTVWLNVLPTEQLKLWAPIASVDEADIFPWLDTTRLSDKSGTNTTPSDVHAAQVFWGMPRRIDLAEPVEDVQYCDLCGEASEELFTEYVTKAYGVNYEGPWEHPLTPHSHDEDHRPNPAKGQPGGLTYQHWEGYVVSSEEDNLKPARVVQHYWRRAHYHRDVEPLFSFRPRMWAFGFDADNMKIRSWHDSEMPLFLLPEEQRQRLEAFSLRLISGADKVSYILGIALKNALYGTPETTSTGRIKWHVADGVTTSASFFQQASDQFWSDTEPPFYEHLSGAVAALEADTSLNGLKVEWAAMLHKEALRIFDHLSQFGEFHSANPKAVALARRDLDRNSNYLRNKRLRKALNLELPDAESASEPEPEPAQ